LAKGVCNNFGDQPLKVLEQERNKLMHETEEQWRQRSRAIWLLSGDCYRTVCILGHRL